MHYVMWSKTPLDQIKAANQGRLDTDRIFIGARVAIPMSDNQYVAFVTARAEWDKAKLEGDKAGKASDKAADDKAAAGKTGKSDKAAKVKRHTVKSGETATSIARAYRIGVKDLKGANPGVDLKKLRIGVKLVVPPKAKWRRLEPGVVPQGGRERFESHREGRSGVVSRGQSLEITWFFRPVRRLIQLYREGARVL